MVKKAVLALCSTLALGCASIGVPRVPSLECDDTVETERHGTVFYSCAQDTNDDVLETFDLIGRVKEYQKAAFGFEDTVNYRQYINTERQMPATSYKLYIVQRDAIFLEPASIIFLSTSQEYSEDIEESVMLWSRKDNLLDEQQRYDTLGFDTYRRAETNYSPGATITPDFIKMALERKIYVVNHEGRHFYNMIILGNNHDRDLEESFATMFGHAATLDFIIANYGVNSASYTEALENLGEWAFFSETVNLTYNRLESLYAQNMPWEETEDAKAEILELVEQRGFIPLNNARILGQLPYTRLFPLVHDIYVTHPDAGELGKILMQCPDGEDEGVEFLRRARYMSAD